jgi:hypothetical protein
LQGSHFEPRTIAVVENAGAALAALRQQPDQAGLVINRSSSVSPDRWDKRNQVVIETDNQTSEPLVLANNYYPAGRPLWTATAAIYQANCTMQP